MSNFWKKLKRPIFCLAPMSDVTDLALRKIVAKYGKPDVFWTEFVSADGLAHPKARKKLLVNLKYSKKEKPIVTQIFGSKPETIKKAVKYCRKLGFSGIDINMGCPDRAVEKQNAGASLIKNPELAKKIILAAREESGNIPVSVKTRIGYNHEEINTWIRELLLLNLPAITIHLRTRKEMSSVPAHWELMKKIVNMRNTISPHTILIGNGDVQNILEAKKKIKETGCDGVMIGRGIFGNPWLFSKHIPSLMEKLKVLVEHARLFEKDFKKNKKFYQFRKTMGAYVSGFAGARELRQKLMQTQNAKQVETVVKKFLNK